MKRDQSIHNISDKMKKRIEELEETEESSFCALLMEMREQSKLLEELILVMRSNSSDSPLNSKVVERIVEVSGKAADKFKTTYESSSTDFIPDVDTSDLEISVKESKIKTTKVNLDDMPEDME